MTVANLQSRIGSTVLVRLESFSVSMTVRDAKTAYGNVRLLVTPVAGGGEAWVDLSRIQEVTEDGK